MFNAFISRIACLVCLTMVVASCGDHMSRLPKSQLTAADEVAIAKEQLDRELALIKQIEPHGRRMDLARLKVITQQIKDIKLSIEAKGLANTQTISLYQQLIVSFRFSVAFFKQIESEDTTKQILELLKINETIIAARGFDDSPYTQVTANVFSHMHRLTLQLIAGPWFDVVTKGQLQALVAPLARTIAIAKEGDRPKTFEAAIPVYHQIEALYPVFNAVMRSHSAFDLVLEVQGLNEWYAEYAQIPPTKKQ